MQQNQEIDGPAKSFAELRDEKVKFLYWPTVLDFFNMSVTNF